MLYQIDDPFYQKQNCVGLRLEDLIKEPTKTIKSVCEWMGIEKQRVVLVSSQENVGGGQRKFGATGQPAFGKSSIEEKLALFLVKKI